MHDPIFHEKLMTFKTIGIAWVISAYQKPDQLIHIIDRIAGPSDTVWIHYDKKSSLKEFEYLRQHYSSNPRVNIFRRYSIYWGGHQSILADWFLGKKLLKSNTEFDYVIHLTGTTYPIKTDQLLRNFLQNNFENSYILLDPDEEISESGSERSQHFAKEHFGIYPGRNIPKYKLLGRTAYKINLKILRLLHKIGAITTKTFLPSAFPEIYRGFVHNIIFREHYLRIFRDPRSQKLLHQLKYTSCPDEVFFNTTLVNTAPAEKLTRNNNLLTTYWRKGTASPDNINENDLHELLNGPSFFARKFESLSLIQEIDKKLKETDTDLNRNV